MKPILLVASLIFLIFSSCQKEEKHIVKKGVFKDLTGLDGCGFVIELQDSKRLDPINLTDFQITPQDGKKVWLKYFTMKGVGNTCMAGKIVRIVYISERN